MARSDTSRGDASVKQPTLERYSVERLSSMLAAADEALECQRALKCDGLNPVGEILKGEESFEASRHYPEEDVYDRESGSQYYYHAHRSEEHGHFHLFLRPARDNRPGRVRTPSHLMAISMDREGVPAELFTTNRWVTRERWRSARQILELARHFRLDNAEPCMVTNRWITAMAVCCRPQMETLLLHRDRTIRRLGGWRRKAILENRDIEVIGRLPLDLPVWREQMKSTMSEKEPS